MHTAIARRPLAIFICVLQLVLGGATGLADAWLESASAGPTAAHVEETGQSCPPAHSEDCRVCRHLTALYGPPASPRDGTPGHGRLAQVDSGATEPSPVRLTGALLPRAPPLT